jgi:hypothetical protein
MSRTVNRFFLLLFVLLLSATMPARADVIKMKDGHPDRYVVKKGDTLWGISSRFLDSPWNWPKVWRNNQQIKNPHLIYPGDVIVFKVVKGEPTLTVERSEKLVPTGGTEGASVVVPENERTVRLQPRVRVESLAGAIPTIPPGAIQPFLDSPGVVTHDELEDAGYVTVGMGGRLILAAGSEFYARALPPEVNDFKIVRRGQPLINPSTGRLLGYESVDLGDARVIKHGDPTKLVMLRARQEVLPTDRLIPAPKVAALPFFQPHAPKKDVHGWILLGENAVAEIGPQTVVAISLGSNDGINEGTVLRVKRHVGKAIDPLTHQDYALPDENAGLVMVFRTFAHVSYALVMSENRPIHVDDAVVTP